MRSLLWSTAAALGMFAATPAQAVVVAEDVFLEVGGISNTCAPDAGGDDGALSCGNGAATAGFVLVDKLDRSAFGAVVETSVIDGVEATARGAAVVRTSFAVRGEGDTLDEMAAAAREGARAAKAEAKTDKRAASRARSDAGKAGRSAAKETRRLQKAETGVETANARVDAAQGRYDAAVAAGASETRLRRMAARAANERKRALAAAKRAAGARLAASRASELARRAVATAAAASAKAEASAERAAMRRAFETQIRKQRAAERKAAAQAKKTAAAKAKKLGKTTKTRDAKAKPDTPPSGSGILQLVVDGVIGWSGTGREIGSGWLNVTFGGEATRSVKLFELRGHDAETACPIDAGFLCIDGGESPGSVTQVWDAFEFGFDYAGPGVQDLEIALLLSASNGASLDFGNTVGATFLMGDGASVESTLGFRSDVYVTPLPAGAWLLLSGFGAAAAFGRRARA
ncbi:MAG: VPLPA-CTERM sorting domain-containing protein [Pseudomonadota bacterium]